jgi:excisionase family DNA binding protein
MTAPVTWDGSAAEALARLEGRLFATVPEAAAILRYDPRTLRAAIVAGEVPAVRAGATYRVRVAWLRSQAGLGDPETPAKAS